MKPKLHLGKTATSRSRKKNTTHELQPYKLPVNDYSDYLLRKGYSQSTVESFLRDLERFNKWLDKEGLEAENAGYNDLTAFLQSFGNIAQLTKSCYLRGVKHYYDFLISQETVIENPAAFIQLRGMKRKTLYDILNRQELDRLYSGYANPETDSKDKNQNWHKTKLLAQQRNKVIAGLMLYQALDTGDIRRLQTADIKLQQGIIYIPGSRRSNERELKLEALQIMDLMTYLLQTRTALLALTGKASEQLFVSIGSGDKIANLMTGLVKQLHRLNPRVTHSKQVRACVIVHWLKLYNLRQVQYMAGHRYVSSTEQFLVNEMEGMLEDIDKYHPTG